MIALIVIRKDKYEVEVIYYQNTDDVRKLIWRNSLCQKEAPDDMPSEIELFPSGNIYSLTWHKADKRHREGDLPAIVTFWDKPALEIASADWYSDGLAHREGSRPSTIQIREDGRVCTLMFCRHGEDCGVDNLPYFIGINDDGTLEDEDGRPIPGSLDDWFTNGLPHLPKREDVILPHQLLTIG